MIAPEHKLFAQVNSPEKLDPADLDAYLEEGWFRMGQTIFTTNFLHFKDHFYSAIWLRISLPDFLIDKTHQRLLRQNSRFKTEIKKASVDLVKESLFSIYRQNVSFEPSASLQTLLFGKFYHTIFNTYEINVYDGDKLIGAGFFDIGATCAMGITSFYDPAYSKYSLGKYMIFLKIDFCRTLNLKYFYPGYFVPGYSFFDYKLGIGKHNLQYLQLRSKRWLPIEAFSAAETPIDMMREKLTSLAFQLTAISIQSTVWWYEFFDVNLHPDLQGAVLFDFPVFLQCIDISNDTINPIIVYDVRDEHYYVLECRSIWISNYPGKEEIYTSNLLKTERVLFSTPSAEGIMSIFSERPSTQ